MNIARLKQIFLDNIWKAVDSDVTEVMETLAIDKVPKMLGQLQGHIKSDTRIENGRVIARIRCDSPYGRYIEEGTGPAAGHDKYMPPVRVILDWMKHRGIGASQKSVGTRGLATMAHIAYAIRWHIYQHGIKAKPFMAPAAAEGRKLLRPALQGAIHKIKREVRSELG